MLEITCFMDAYKKKCLAPSTTSSSYSTVSEAVNSVVLVTNQKWEDVVKSLIEQAHYRGNMPSYKTCITDLFRKSGFVPVQCNKRINTLLEECNNAFSLSKKYIIKICYSYFALVPDNETKKYHFEGLWQGYHPTTCCWIAELWEYTPGTDNRTGIKRVVKEKYAHNKEFAHLKIKNMNPENKNTGDCSVRGLSAAYGCTWHEALDHMAKASNFAEPVLNSIQNIDTTLIKLGFERHKPIKQDDMLLNGTQFCEFLDSTYRKGERIFAYIGNRHCVAILPMKQKKGRVKYMIQDTWDCTDGYIGEWYVYKEGTPMVPDTPPCTVSFECGQVVCHPKFGEGSVLSITGSDDARILEIEFKQFGIKKIAESWLKSQHQKGKLNFAVNI